MTQETVRLSVGIEHIDDILADLDQALAATAAGRPPRHDRRRPRPRRDAAGRPLHARTTRSSWSRARRSARSRSPTRPTARWTPTARNAVFVHHALTGRRARRRPPRRPVAARLVGPPDRPRAADRHRPLLRRSRRTCSAAARARPGPRRSIRRRARRTASSSRCSACATSTPCTGGCSSTWGSAGCTRRSAGRSAACRRCSGRSTTRRR